MSDDGFDHGGAGGGAGDPATGRAVDAVVETIAETAPIIRDGLVGRREPVDEENPSGETQAEADVWADELLAERLAAIDGVAQYASEERETTLDCGGSATDAGSIAVAVDPLDGSSNLESNNPMGTVFGCYGAALPAGDETDGPSADGDAERAPTGRDLLAAGYVCFGPITTMVVAREGTVTEYELTGDEPTVIDDDLTLPGDPVVYGFGGRVPDWPGDFAAYVEEIERELKLRYGGAMIADVNQVLTYGGTFAYPGLESRPEGKLRLLFEGHPIAAIVEAAGGASSNGERSLLDVPAEALHQRTPVHVGNDDLIDRLEAALS